MPYSKDNPPSVSKNWTAGEQAKCIKAANAVLREDGSEQDAIFACIRAAGKTKHPGGKSMIATVKAMFGIGSKEMSHDEVRNAIYDALPQPAPLLSMDESTRDRYYVKAVYDGYAIIESGGQLFKATYKVNKKNELTLGDLKQVEVAYVAIRDKANRVAVGMKSIKSAFEIVVDSEGKDRWVSLTASAFKDREGQIAMNKALESYADAAMKSGIHGDLWFGHFPMRIGEPDIHLVVNKHLVESGTFDDTDEAIAMKGYLKEHGPWEVSYTFLCSKEDDKADLFEWVWPLERSPLPVGTAAHPVVKRLNMMGVKGMSEVSEKAKTALIAAIGEAKFKEYEGDTSRLSELMSELGIESKGVNDATGSPDEGKGEGGGAEGEGEGKPAPPAEGQDAVLKMLEAMEGRLTLLAEATVELAETQKSLGEKFTEVETQVKSLEVGEDEKIGAYVASLSARDKARMVADGNYRPRAEAGVSQKSGDVGQSPDDARQEFQAGLGKDASGWEVAHRAFERATGIPVAPKQGGDGNG